MADSYLRYPDIHGDQVVCCAGDDVWLAPLSGGRAWRLTSDECPVSYPRFSPDGRYVAWTSTRDGHQEAMVLELAGGSPRRLTWWGSATTRVLGWTADQRVLVASAAGEDNSRHLVVKAVDLDGATERLRVGPASGVAIHPDGPVVVSTPGSRPPAYWKRYRGGTASRLWLDRVGDGAQYEPLLPGIQAGLVSPLWIGDRLVFASDLAASLPGRADGQADLFSIAPLDGAGQPRAGEPLQHTAHTIAEGYLRDPSSDGRRIVYHARGLLYLLDSLDAEPQPLEISVGGGLAGRRRRLLRPSDQLTAVRPDLGGDASLLEWRGNAFQLVHRQGPARAVAAEPGVRFREPRLFGTTGLAIMVSDAAGEDRLEIRSLSGETEPRHLASGQLGRVLHLEVSPAADRVAAISHDGGVHLVDVDSGQVRTVAHSTEGEAKSPTFSSDGRYLVWSQPTVSDDHHQLMAVDLETDEAPAVALTSGRFSDTSPSFTLDGRYLAFLSARTFDPSYDVHSFNLSFGSALRPCLIPLSATEPAPFGPSVEGWQISSPKDHAAARSGSAQSQPTQSEPAQSESEVPPSATVSSHRSPGGPEVAALLDISAAIDLDGFEERIIPFPVPSDSYRDLQAVDGGVLWIREMAKGALGTARAGVEAEAPADMLEFFSFPARKVEVLADKIDTYAPSGDGKRLVVREGDSMVVCPAAKRVDKDSAERVEVDLSRLRHEVDPVAEWQQMFNETTRLMAELYWRDDLDGVDWRDVIEHYRPVVGRLGCHDDLVDLLWETVGEMNTSHAYVQPANPAGDQKRKLGLLGADLALAPDGSWVIERILPGESSDPAARSPLRAAGVNAQVGDVMASIGGRPLSAELSPAMALVGAANQPIELTLRSAEEGSSRRVVVVPIEDEETLRYQAWVASRRDYIREHAEGRLGYLHVPDMMSVGWAQIHRDIELATRAEGLIVDVRYNRGGHTSQLVIERLSRKVLGWTTARHFTQRRSYPEQSPRGPVIFVANEFSGSDGDIVNAAAQASHLGPIVGVRTWGGVIGIDGRFSLVDGTSVTQPRYAFWLKGYGWGVENHGVDPDIEVAVSPADFFAGQDPQLDRAIAEALARLAKSPAEQPPTIPPARVSRE